MLWNCVSIKHSAWARQNGISDKAAWKWRTAGKVPVPARQMPTGRISVEAAERKEVGVRRSSAVQKADPYRQVARMAAFAAENDMLVAKGLAEVGRGLNGHRQDYGAVVVGIGTAWPCLARSTSRRLWPRRAEGCSWRTPKK